jgi:hypothetical protein
MTDSKEERSPAQASKWATAFVRADHNFWNWIQQRASIFVKVWFEWLNWIALLTAFEIASQRYDSHVAEVVKWISYTLLLYYFHSLYWGKIEEPKESPVSGVKIRSMTSWMVAFLGAFGVMLLVKSLVSSLVRGTPH